MISFWRFFGIFSLCWVGGVLVSRFALDYTRPYRVEIDNLHDVAVHISLLSVGGSIVSGSLAGLLFPDVANHWLTIIAIAVIVVGVFFEHLLEIYIPVQEKPELREPHYGQQGEIVRAHV